jgi:hypothetical protein
MFGYRARGMSAGEPISGTRVRITPNRQQIDNRFPVLRFTIHTDTLTHFEVLLSSDPALFNEQNAGRRSNANYYSSRRDSGLIASAGGEAVYLVPPLILQQFASAVPCKRRQK